jgi:hypothetical protein
VSHIPVFASNLNELITLAGLAAVTTIAANLLTVVGLFAVLRKARR